MRLFVVVPRTFSLLDDPLNRSYRRLQISDGEQAREAEIGIGYLGLRRADEQLLLTELLGEIPEAVFNAPRSPSASMWSCSRWPRGTPTTPALVCTWAPL